MSTSTISLTLPIADAGRSRRSGCKAISLSEMIAARFAVPRGFVVSADAYRAHLWTSGARKIASNVGDAEDRERIRSAILSADIPMDVWQAVSEAYKRLSWQTGYAEPKVAVRSSAIENGASETSFPGAYESILNVSGLDELQAAIKRVWASLWNGKAAAYRMRLGVTAEPAMAVIIQQMLEVGWSGTVQTANPITGDPNTLMVSCASSASSDSDPAIDPRFHINLRYPWAPQLVEQKAEPEQAETVSLVCEKAILIEDVLGGPVEVEWARDDDGLWILQARRIEDILPHSQRTDGASQISARRGAVACDNHQLRALTPHLSDAGPISYFARAQIEASRKSEDAPFREDCAHKTRDGFRLLARWEREIEPDLKARISEIMARDLSRVDHARLLRTLAEAEDTCVCARQWLDWISYPCTKCPEMLHELVREAGGDESLYKRLLGSLPDAMVMRDARLQELGERFRAAEESDKLDNEKWRRGYKRDVEAFARNYGYSFKNLGELHDIASWKSWIEDTDAVFHMIGAIAGDEPRPSVVTLHCAAEEEAARAEEEAAKMFDGKGRRRFRNALHLSRRWLPKKSECEQILALACSALRLVLMEMGRRLRKSGLIAEEMDIFCLSAEELLALPEKPTDAERSDVASLIARRKHDYWLEHRAALFLYN